MSPVKKKKKNGMTMGLRCETRSGKCCHHTKPQNTACTPPFEVILETQTSKNNLCISRVTRPTKCRHGRCQKFLGHLRMSTALCSCMNKFSFPLPCQCVNLLSISYLPILFHILTTAAIFQFSNKGFGYQIVIHDLSAATFLLHR